MVTPRARPARLVREFVRLLLDAAPWRSTLAVALMIAAALTAGVSLALLAQLLQLVGLGVQHGAIESATRSLVNGLAFVGLAPTLPGVLFAFLLITAIQASLARFQTMLRMRLEFDLVARVRARLFTTISRTSWIAFSRMRSSDLTHALTAGVDQMGSSIYFLVTLAATAVIALVYLAVAIRLSPGLTLLVMAAGAMLMVGLRRRRRLAEEHGDRRIEAQRRLFSAISEFIAGLKIARAYGAEERHRSAFVALSEDVRDAHSRAGRNHADVQMWLEVGTIGILAIVVYGGVSVGHLSVGDLLLLLFLFSRLMPLMTVVATSYQGLVGELPALAAIRELENRCLLAPVEHPMAASPIRFDRSVQFDRVCFGYGSSSVLKDLSLTIRVGETTALVGPSGGGKSTVADLLLGLLRPDSGSILVDGVPLDGSRLESWRQQLAYVTQDAFLFHDSLRANLLWSWPDATTDDVWTALRLASADAFVARLPQGLDTVLGDRGILLSGGERQRLALARALLREPRLLVLDEATSSLDFENERAIQDAIDSLHGRISILIITHRLSTIRHADVIHVLDGGSIVESGTWDDLIGLRNGRLRGLYDAHGGAETEPGMKSLPNGELACANVGAPHLDRDGTHRRPS